MRNIQLEFSISYPSRSTVCLPIRLLDTPIASWGLKTVRPQQTLMMVADDGGIGVGQSEGNSVMSPQNGHLTEGSSHRSKADSFSLSNEEELPPIRNASGVAFWNINIPPSEWTDECPDYLQYAFQDHKDRAVLLKTDAEHQRQSWADVHDLIRGNRLDQFKRVPSQLRLYRAYCTKLIREHGSIMNFVLKERLHWEDLKFSSSPPFTNPGTFAAVHVSLNC